MKQERIQISKPVPSAFSTVGPAPETNALAEAIGSDLSIARSLLKRGAKADKIAVSAALRTNDIQFLEILWEHNGDFRGSVCSAIGAVALTNMETLRWLLDKGVDPNEPCPSLCHAANMYYRQLEEQDRKRNDALNIARILIDNGANPNVYCNKRRSSNPLKEALDSKNLKVADYLLSKGADPNIQFYDGKTALFYVRGIDEAKLLVSYGADKHYETASGWNAAKYRQHRLGITDKQLLEKSSSSLEKKKALIRFLQPDQ